MVVDDIPDNTFIMKELLGRQKVKAITSNEAACALSIFIRESNFDAVITDLRMPGMSGQTFISEIRKYEQEKKSRAVPIVVVTAENSSTEKIFCMNTLGANEYLLKPIKLNDLLLSLSKLLTGQEKETKNILIVEDEALSASVISRILTGQGHKIIVCGDILSKT